MAVYLTLWYIVFVCHQNDVCEDSTGSVYAGGYRGLSKSELCVLDKLCSSGLLQSVLMSYVDYDDDG